MGANRPTCKECGRVELDQIGRFIWNLLAYYSEALVTVTGFGKFIINIPAVNFLADEYGFKDKLLLLRGIQTIVKEAMNQELEKTNDN